MSPRSLGLLVMAIGAMTLVVGALIAVGAFSWFGRLPGDIRIEGERTRIYIPLASALVISVVLTILFSILRR